MEHFVAKRFDPGTGAKGRDAKRRRLSIPDSHGAPLELHTHYSIRVFVFRWLRLAPGSIDEWTGLCNETWPNFQQRSRSECLAVWQVERDDHLADEILMCTWYEDLHAWEHSREVDPADAPKWRRRAELEYNHWGIGARRME